MKTRAARRWALALAPASALLVTTLLFARQAPQVPLAPQAILLNPAAVNGSIAGSSWWLANQSVVVTWSTANGLRVSSVFDRVGGRTGTKPGDAFTIALEDGWTIRSSDCQPLGTPTLTAATVEHQTASIFATFACPKASIVVNWKAELTHGAHAAKQYVTLTKGSGVVFVDDVGYGPPAAKPGAAGQAQDAHVRIINGPYLQDPGPTHMTVMWVADRQAVGWVEYREGREGAWRPALPVSDGLVDVNARIHRVTITGLTPGTSYTYRILTRAITSFGPYKVDYDATVSVDSSLPWEFETLKSGTKPFSFLVFNDLHEGVPVFESHLNHNAGRFDLLFYNGDSLDHIESESQILDHLLKPASGYASNCPFLFVRGNHETRGKMARDLRNYLTLPGGRYYYSFDQGPVHFVVLDTGEDKEDEHWAYSGLTDFFAYRQAEREWLKQEVATPAFKNAKFRVLVAHMPFFGGPRTRISGAGPLHCREMFGDILNDAGLDLHIAGHTHRADWVEPGSDGNRFPVVVGGGNQAGSSTMTRVNVTADQLEIIQTTDDGKVVSTHTVPARR